MSDRVLIVGGGQAAFQCALSLRSGGFQGRVAIFGEERHAPYMRPPLSKGFIRREVGLGDLVFRTPERLSTDNIEFYGGHAVTRVDIREKSIQVDERHERFDVLVFATGSRARTLSIPGSNLGGIHYLRTIADAQHLGSQLVEAKNIVVIGGGFIGLEFASVARGLDKVVTVVEAAPRLCGRAVSPLMSDWLLQLHRDNGVQVILGSIVSGFEGAKMVSSVRLAEQSLSADLVVVGVGSIANDELASGAGLAVDGGIAVDTHLGAGLGGLYAIGDCARFIAHPWNKPVRLESVQNAVDQAKFVAGQILGDTGAYRKVPWFWTEQFGHKVQMAGLCHGSDLSVVDCAPSTKKFNMRHLEKDRLVAVDSINDAKAHIAARKELSDTYIGQ